MAAGKSLYCEFDDVGSIEGKGIEQPGVGLGEYFVTVFCTFSTRKYCGNFGTTVHDEHVYFHVFCIESFLFAV